MGIFSKVILLSYTIWLLCYVFFPGKYIVSNDSVNATLFVVVNLMFLVTSYEFFRRSSKIKTLASNKVYLSKFHFLVILFISIIGVATRLYVRIAKEGLLSYNSFSQFRLATLNSPIENGLIDILSAITYPFSFILLLVIIDRRFYVTGLIKYISLVLGLYVFIDTIILGSRIQLVLFGLIVLLAFQGRNSFKRIKLKHLFGIFLGVGLFLIYSMNIIFDRIDKMGIVVSNIVSFWETGHGAIYERNIHRIETDTLFGRLKLSLISIQHYLVHGFFEFKRLFGHNHGNSPLLLGSEQFNIVYKFFEILFDIESTDNSMFKHKIGVYNTFWGVVFLDWGWYSIIYSSILGWFISLLEKSKKVSYPLLILYRYFLVVLSGVAFLNLFIGSNLYFFFSVILFYIILKMKI